MTTNNYGSFKDEILRAQPWNQRIQTVELTRQEYCAMLTSHRQQVEQLKADGQFEAYMDHVKDQLVMRMFWSVYGKQHGNRHVIRFPSTWWDVVKERFAPAWFRDRFPVKYETIYATLEEIYPDIKPALPNRNPVMRFAVSSSLEIPTW